MASQPSYDLTLDFLIPRFSSLRNQAWLRNFLLIRYWLKVMDYLFINYFRIYFFNFLCIFEYFLTTSSCFSKQSLEISEISAEKEESFRVMLDLLARKNTKSEKKLNPRRVAKEWKLRKHKSMKVANSCDLLITPDDAGDNIKEIICLSINLNSLPPSWLFCLI